jgi:hypothetical protein
MPTYHVVKGSQFGYLEQLFGPPPANFMAQYQAALDQLQNPTVTLEAAAQARANASPGSLSGPDVDHLKNHWLGAPGPNWVQLAVPDTLRAGFIEAIKHAQSVQMPMEVLWICALDKDFHVYYVEGRNQVTVLVFTPPPDQGAATTAPLTTPEKIWVVKLRDNHDGAAYTAKGPAIPGALVVAQSTGVPTMGRDIIKQQLFHT